MVCEAKASGAMMEQNGTESASNLDKFVGHGLRTKLHINVDIYIMASRLGRYVVNISFWFLPFVLMDMDMFIHPTISGHNMEVIINVHLIDKYKYYAIK